MKRRLKFYIQQQEQIIPSHFDEINSLAYIIKKMKMRDLDIHNKCACSRLGMGHVVLLERPCTIPRTQKLRFLDLTVFLHPECFTLSISTQNDAKFEHFFTSRLFENDVNWQKMREIVLWYLFLNSQCGASWDVCKSPRTDTHRHPPGNTFKWLHKVGRPNQ